MGWRKSGIWLTHAGLILLLLGELVSGLVQRDYQMTLAGGETKDYSESSLRSELAIVDETDPAFDDVVAIPESLIAKGTAVQNPKLPFKVVPRGFFPNADLQMRSKVPGAPPSLATQGSGPDIAVMPLEVTYAEDGTNWPAAYVELVGPDRSLGTWLVSAVPIPTLNQRFEYGGRRWRIVMRAERHYQPFSLTLEKFSHDLYPGTSIPRNFSSKVRINLPDGGTSREALIYMNNPLRFAGLTFYQQSFKPDDSATILEVVRNPSWLVPYIACAAIALGLVIQFMIHLAAFASKRRESP